MLSTTPHTYPHPTLPASEQMSLPAGVLSNKRCLGVSGQLVDQRFSGAVCINVYSCKLFIRRTKCKNVVIVGRTPVP